MLRVLLLRGLPQGNVTSGIDGSAILKQFCGNRAHPHLLPTLPNNEAIAVALQNCTTRAVCASRMGTGCNHLRVDVATGHNNDVLQATFDEK